MEPALIISIIGISFTFLIGVWNIRINLENQKMKRLQLYREESRCYKEMYDVRPKLEITDFSDLNSFVENESFDIDCIVVPIKNVKTDKNRIEFDYLEEIKDKSEWVSLTYVVKNIGKSTIDHLYLAWNSPKNTSLFDVKDNVFQSYIDNKMLNYRVMYERNVKSNQSINVRINFHKDYIHSGIFSSEASFWLIDEYRKIWEQPFFVHRNLLYESSLSDEKTLKNMTDIKDAIECFKNPYLW